MGNAVELHDPSDAFAFDDGRIYPRRQTLRRLLPELHYTQRQDCKSLMEGNDIESCARICASVISHLECKRPHYVDSVTQHKLNAAIRHETHLLRSILARMQESW